MTALVSEGGTALAKFIYAIPTAPAFSPSA